MNNWYCAKSLESYNSRHAKKKFLVTVLENLVLTKAADMLEADRRATLIGTEQAILLQSQGFTSFTGDAMEVRFEAIRSLKRICPASQPIKIGTTLSCSLFEPLEGAKSSSFVEQSRVLRVKYLGESLDYVGHVSSSDEMDSYESAKDANEPWECAHMIFCMIPLNDKLRELVHEEVKIFAAAPDVWTVAESVGKNLEQSRKEVDFRSETYRLRFEGVRQVTSIQGPEVYSVPMDPSEATHTKYEVESEIEITNLLNGNEALVTVMPSSLCHLNLGQQR